jgi:hypothetical protein
MLPSFRDPSLVGTSGAPFEFCNAHCCAGDNDPHHGGDWRVERDFVSDVRHANVFYLPLRGKTAKELLLIFIRRRSSPERRSVQKKALWRPLRPYLLKQSWQK